MHIARNLLLVDYPAYAYAVIDGVKVPREDEQVVIRQLRAMREAGAGYRQIAEWMKNTHDRTLTIMGVKRVLSQSLCSRKLGETQPC